MSQFLQHGIHQLQNQGALTPLATVLLLSSTVFIYRYFLPSLSKVTPKEPRRHKITNKEFNSEYTEVLIVGSGVAGSALAASLARAGRHVTVIERDLREPDRIVGELLQPGGCRSLQQLGLQDCVNGFDAHDIKGYIIHDNESGAQVQIPYDEQLASFAGGDCSNLQGKAFHHGRFIQSLRRAAKSSGAHYLEGTAVKLIEEDNVVKGIQYRKKGGDDSQTILADLTVVSDGCFSKFRKQLVKDCKPRTYSHFVGAIMRDCPQAASNHAELVLTSGSPVLIYQISSCETRVLVDIKGALPSDLRQYLMDVIHPQMPEHCKEPFAEAVCGDRIRSMPCSFLPASETHRHGALLLGDALNMRHPLTGGGMSVALADVAIWTRLLTEVKDLRNHDELDRLRVAFMKERRPAHAFVVNILSIALYELFAADDEYLASLRRACFKYFKLGGSCVSGPVGLLSVVRPKPHILIGHFFAVALYAVYMEIRSRWWLPHLAVAKAIAVLARAVTVITPLVWSELRFSLSS